ncbi:MAG TPA: hypothetical protein VNE38_09705 [Ktedonobacteraceae bacterium]|nr:hypothetical protein [Ktedonobacteraceae bacterium]
MREDTEQHSVVTQCIPLQEQQRSKSGWMRYFITDDISPDNSAIIDLQRRACWIGMAMILQAINEIPSYVYTAAMPFLIPWANLISFSLITTSFVALWMALRPATLKQRLEKSIAAQKRPRRWQRVIVVLLLITSLVGGVQLVRSVAMGFFMTPSYRNDGTSLDTNAAALLSQGLNPYVDSSILNVVRRFPIQPDWTTPLRQGQLANSITYPTVWELRSILDTDLKSGSAPEFESKVSYPALSFLSLLPFTWLNNNNTLPFYLLCYLLIMFIGWKKVRPELRPWLLLASMADVSMWTAVIGGSLDLFYILLVLLSWLLLDSRWWSAIFLGLAFATKQLAWFYVPFYAILVWRRYSLREASWRISAAGLIALAINLPFILWNPQAWLAGVLAPVADPMFAMGAGIVALSSIPIFPTFIYTTLEALAMLCCVAWFWRICKSRPEAAMILAVLPLFFAWRSLPSYFTCAALPIFILQSVRPSRRRESRSQRAALPLWNIEEMRTEANSLANRIGTRAAFQSLRLF